MRKLFDVAHEEFASFQLRLLWLKLFTFFLPKYIGGRWRAAVFRLTGFRVGKGTLIGGMPTMTGEKDFYKRLSIGTNVWLNIGCVFDLGAPITIGNHVDVGHEVLFITTSHKIGGHLRRAADREAKPIKIEDGVWLGARCTILPGVTVGEGAIVAAGAVVVKDVPANTIAAGVPAKVIRELPLDPQPA